MTTETSVEFEDGDNYGSEEHEEIIERPHHTAVVERYTTNGLVIIEQNFPEGSKVARNALPLSNSGPTTKTSFKTMKDSKGRTRPAKILVATTIEVTGRIWAYRPKEAEGKHAPKGKK